ncbi:hypothetical protein AVEN_197973-1 [Araneus ventricosus]|uniref:Uncharacterized protein n=1 Tax=Araneus ventricosus TaxID=182803 RepID=A0A4Y2JHX6_ARAVE|nr:hypothetical protein AVEN_197973-1 [Araneus ventricosus]
MHLCMTYRSWCNIRLLTENATVRSLVPLVSVKTGASELNRCTRELSSIDAETQSELPKFEVESLSSPKDNCRKSVFRVEDARREILPSKQPRFDSLAATDGLKRAVTA